MLGQRLGLANVALLEPDASVRDDGGDGYEEGADQTDERTKDRNCTGNEVSDSHDGEDAAKPREPVGLAIRGEVRRVAKDANKERFGGDLSVSFVLSGVEMSGPTWQYRQSVMPRPGSASPYATFLSRGPAEPKAGDTTY